jgi:protein SCO1
MGFLRSFLYPYANDPDPIPAANRIINHSNGKLSTILMPGTGRLVTSKGNGSIDCAGQGNKNNQEIPLYLTIHKLPTKVNICNIVANKMFQFGLNYFIVSPILPLCLVKQSCEMKKKTAFYLFFFGTLVIVFYLVLTKIIPGYGEVKMPVLSSVQPFSFTDQDGKRITNNDVAGKVYVAEYFFTTCKGICPKMNSNLWKLYQNFKNDPEFCILSHTVDPGTDTVGRMKRYADSLGADSKNWFFLTGRKDSLYYAARVSYLLDDPKNNNTNLDDQFIHTQFFALVDKNGRVRKIVDGLKKDEISELQTDIEKLLKEKSTNPHFVNSLFNNNPN